VNELAAIGNEELEGSQLYTTYNKQMTGQFKQWDSTMSGIHPPDG
jgi:hypothetical protein